MGRRELLVIPLACLCAVLLARSLQAGWALLAGVAIGCAAAAFVAWRQRRHIAAAADRIAQLSREGGDAPADLGRGQYAYLQAAIAAAERTARRADSQLQHQRARVERVLDAQDAAVLLFTPDTLAYANRAARTLFGMPSVQVRTALQVLGVTGLAQAVAEARESGSSVQVEVERDGRTLVARASPTVGSEVALVVVDITESRLVEAMRTDFVINASHELKTPVAGILALAESLPLAMRRDPARARVMVSRLNREATRLAQLVRDLLDLARIEELSGERVRQAVDVGEVVRGQVARLKNLAVERDVAVVVEAIDAVRVLGAPEDVRLIASNLLHNAVQYNRAGGSVRVAVRRDGDKVVLDVVDTGIGIPAADRDRIFERFYRVDKARSRAAGGTGLGLSLVRHATARLGGRVTVDSVLGEGSVFRVEVPVEGSPPR